jgi:hypothetical protein
MLGGVTGNSHGAATRRAPITPPAQTPPAQTQPQPAPAPTREYEIPKDPPAVVTPHLPRGEHSERLRVFNQGQATTRAATSLARRERRVSGMDLATAFKTDPDEIEHAGGGFRSAVSVLLILALVGGGVYYYLNPAALGKTTAWFQDRFQQARAHSSATNPELPVWDNRPRTRTDRNSGTNTGTNTGSTDGAIVANSNVGSVATNSNNSKIDQPFVMPTLPAPSTQPVAQAPPPVPDPAPAPATAPSQKTDEKAIEKTAEKTADKSPPPAPAPTPEVKKPLESEPTSTQANAEKPKPKQQPKVEDAPPVLSDDAAIERSRKLWTRALDAEGKGDYAEAVRCYEEIKKLPRVAQQRGLDIRLANAKAIAGR